MILPVRTPPGGADVTDDTSRRPWWRRKRTATALVLWLLVAYPLSVGPAAYATQRGWITQATAEAYAWPIEAADDAAEAVGDAYQAYVDWFEDVGDRHARP